MDIVMDPRQMTQVLQNKVQAESDMALKVAQATAAQKAGESEISAKAAAISALVGGNLDVTA